MQKAPFQGLFCLDNRYFEHEKRLNMDKASMLSHLNCVFCCLVMRICWVSGAILQ